MRDFFNAILEFIGADSLTDDEFESIDTEISAEYTKDAYDALRTVLEARESVSDYVLRLSGYFVGRGVDVSDSYTPKSNILIGGPVV